VQEVHYKTPASPNDPGAGAVTPPAPEEPVPTPMAEPMPVDKKMTGLESAFEEN
jgi:hypothetical protein